MTPSPTRRLAGGGRGPDRVGRRADARAALDPRAVRRRAAARRPAGRRLPARHRRDREPRPHARGGRRRGRAVRGQPAVHPGRRRRGARRADGAEVHAVRGEDADAYAATSRALVGLRRRRSRSTTAPTCSRRCTPAGRPAAPGMLGGDRGDDHRARPRCARWRPRAGSRARSSPSTRRAPSARSTTATAPGSRRSTASCAPPTCCSPGAPSSCSATAGPGRGVALRARGAGAR